MSLQKLSLLIQERAEEDRKHVRETVKLLKAEGKTPQQLQRMIDTNNAYMEREKQKDFTCFRAIIVVNEAA